MTNDAQLLNELHWLMDMVQIIDVGLVVLDRDYNVALWNGFMENHSGVGPHEIKGKNLFNEFPELPAAWLKHKMQSVHLLKNRAFISWEQRPYVFKFKNYRPITGRGDFMYQNVTLLPLTSVTGDITHISLLVYDVTDVAVKKLQLKAMNEQLAHLSQTDGLTELYNRRHWQECLHQEFERFHRYSSPVSLVMFDIDKFKQVNDAYGHPAGDLVIRHIANLLKESLRETDCAGRYGGEEFAVLLPGTCAKEALHFTERLRNKVCSSSVEWDGKQISISISLGICEASALTESASQWLSQADEALYQAKSQGRNCSVIYQQAAAQKQPD